MRRRRRFVETTKGSGGGSRRLKEAGRVGFRGHLAPVTPICLAEGSISGGRTGMRRMSKAMKEGEARGSRG